MAEIQVSAKAGRGKKTPPPRIDLTPMVDLGFLLITFFMYTTTMANPHAMEINMPSNEITKTPTAFIEESTITLIAGKNHAVFYYNGSLKDERQLMKTSVDKVRNVIINKKNVVAALPENFSKEAHKLHVLIKAGAGCTYGDIVALLDEMNIVDVPYYALVDVTPEEKEMIRKNFYP
jgi:biopolymer transport protein ExbD